MQRCSGVTHSRVHRQHGPIITRPCLNPTVKQSSPGSDGGRVAPSSPAGRASRAPPRLLSFPDFNFTSNLDPELTRALTVGGVLSRERHVQASAGAARCCAEAGCSPVGDESMWALRGGGGAGGVRGGSALLLFAVARFDRLCSYLSRCTAR